MNEDEIVLISADLSDTLRRWLRSRREPSPAQAGALAYELAALIAKNAPTLTVARELIDVWASVMKAQVEELGIGVEHP